MSKTFEYLGLCISYLTAFWGWMVGANTSFSTYMCNKLVTAMEMQWLGMNYFKVVANEKHFGFFQGIFKTRMTSKYNMNYVAQKMSCLGQLCMLS